MKNVINYVEQFWGHAISMVKQNKDGSVFIMGHGRGITQDSYLLVQMASEKTGYMQILDISYFSNPTDMWEATAKFVGYDKPADAA